MPNETDEENNLFIYAKCVECNQELNVFNSYEDGYDNWYKKHKPKEFKVNYEQFKCKKCQNDAFNVKTLLEYNDEDFNKKINQKFDWIWADLTCSNCGKKYKKFVDVETG